MIARFDKKRGYGFITPAAGGEDIFFRQGGLKVEGETDLIAGDKVRYELETTEKGGQAIHVALNEPRAAKPVLPNLKNIHWPKLTDLLSPLWIIQVLIISAARRSKLLLILYIVIACQLVWAASYLISLIPRSFHVSEVSGTWQFNKADFDAKIAAVPHNGIEGEHYIDKLKAIEERYLGTALTFKSSSYTLTRPTGVENFPCWYECSTGDVVIVHPYTTGGPGGIVFTYDHEHKHLMISLPELNVIFDRQ